MPAGVSTTKTSRVAINPATPRSIALQAYYASLGDTSDLVNGTYSSTSTSTMMAASFSASTSTMMAAFNAEAQASKEGPEVFERDVDKDHQIALLATHSTN